MAASVESTNAAFADSEVHVFLGISLDGFIAGPNGELDWLEACIPTVDNFTPFMERVGAIVMGRKTFDVVAGKCPPGTDWPYGDIPMLVPTSRPIGAELFAARPSVQAATGTILEILALAREQAGPGKLVYVDGGSVVRQSLDAGLVDEITLSVVPKARFARYLAPAFVYGTLVSLTHRCVPSISRSAACGSLVQASWKRATAPSLADSSSTVRCRHWWRRRWYAGLAVRVAADGLQASAY